jgi:myosin heavy subunit
LDCNPILEAFGNSKTIRNSNSSRFGKYVRLYLDGMCSIKGAKIESYLLEKSRVVAVSQQERNFHVFYCLAVHPSRVQYGLQQTEKFEFLEQSACHTAEGINDKENFECVDDAFKKVGFTVDEIKKIWESVACILLLGNIKFDETAHLQNMNNSCTFSDKLLADRVTKLLRTPNI